MERPSVRFAIFSQLSLFAGALVCVTLTDYPIRKGWPYSSYGTFLHTFVPFALGLGLSSIFLLLCRNSIHYRLSKYRLLCNLIATIAVLQFGIVITPYTWGLGFAISHLLLSISLFAVQLIFSLTIARKLLDSKLAYTAVALQIIAAIAALLSSHLFSALPLILPAQALATITFSILFIWTISGLSANGSS